LIYGARFTTEGPESQILQKLSFAEMAAQCCTSRIFPFEWVSLFLMHSFSVTFENVTMCYILSKIRLFGLHFL